MGVEEARARFERVAFAQFLGVSVVEVSHERAVLRLPFQEDNANQGSVLHGGATASLIHMAGTLAAWTDIDLQAAPLVNTANLAIQYLDAAFYEEITAEAMVLHRGRDIFFLDVTVRGEEHQLISKGLMVYRAPHYTVPMRLYSRPIPPATAPTPNSPPCSSQTIKTSRTNCRSSHCPTVRVVCAWLCPGPPRMVMSRGTYTLVPLLLSWTLPPPMPPGAWCNRKAPVGQPSGCN